MENLKSNINNNFSDINNEENIIALRNKDLDTAFCNLAYYYELLNTKASIKSFTEDLINQLAILAVGGNRKVLDINCVSYVDEDYIDDLVLKHKDTDPIISDLYEIYNQVMLIYTGFASIVDKNKYYFDLELKKLLAE